MQIVLLGFVRLSHEPPPCWWQATVALISQMAWSGSEEGNIEGSNVRVGPELVFMLGLSDRMADGIELGAIDGTDVGFWDGTTVGSELGTTDGIPDGCPLGNPVGLCDGMGLGLAVGAADGFVEGAELGCFVFVGLWLGLKETLGFNVGYLDPEGIIEGY